MSGKLLLKLDATAYILMHHTAEEFPFLDAPANSRNRTVFYLTLAKLLFMEDTPAQFKAFAAPLQQARGLCLPGLGAHVAWFGGIARARARSSSKTFAGPLQQAACRIVFPACSCVVPCVGGVLCGGRRAGRLDGVEKCVSHPTFYHDSPTLTQAPNTPRHGKPDLAFTLTPHLLHA